MARDLYRLFADRYNQARPFSMITRSEQRHYDAVGSLLVRYAVADPSSGRAAGSYAFPEIQKLYDGWKARGLTSVKAAAQVGVELERRDIADLKEIIARTPQTDVKGVLGNLLRGSENHLAAYTRAAAGQQPGSGRGMGGGNGAGPGMRAGAGPGMAGTAGRGRDAGSGPRQGLGAGQGRGAGQGDCPLASG